MRGGGDSEQGVEDQGEKNDRIERFWIMTQKDLKARYKAQLAREKYGDQQPLIKIEERNETLSSNTPSHKTTNTIVTVQDVERNAGTGGSPNLNSPKGSPSPKATKKRGGPKQLSSKQYVRYTKKPDWNFDDIGQSHYEHDQLKKRLAEMDAKKLSPKGKNKRARQKSEIQISSLLEANKDG